MDLKSGVYQRYRQDYRRRLKGVSQEPVTQATLVLILSLLTVSFFGIFAIKPTLITIAELIREIKDKEVIEQQLQTKIEALSQAQTDFEKLKPHLEAVEKVMPREVSFLRLLSEINLLAWENKIVLESGHFDRFSLVNKSGILVLEEETEKEPVAKREKKEKEEPEKEHGLAELAFTLVARGNYKNLKKFISDLNNIDRLIVIETTAIGTEKTEEEGLALDLKAKAFYLKNGQ